MTKTEIKELVPLARGAVDTEESPWIQLGDYFRRKREVAKEKVEPRPIQETK